MNVQSIAVIEWLFLKYLDSRLSLEWMLTSADLSEGNTGSMSVASFLQQELHGIKLARGPSADVM